MTISAETAERTGSIERVRKEGLGEVDSRDWQGDWHNQWVVFADLIGFGDRSVRSEHVVLNNIVRFDRASKVVRDLFPHDIIRTYRFSDSTFGVAKDFSAALAFAVAMHHVCLASNAHHIQRVKNPLFIHTIAPRVTLAQGNVLTLPDQATDELRFENLDPKSVVAGAGIVNAHNLERYSAGGLLTLDKAAAQKFRSAAFRGGPDSMRDYLETWKSQATAPPPLFWRRDILDVPWLLLRPEQPLGPEIWCASKAEARRRIQEFLNLWELSFQELYSVAGSGSPPEVTKHAASAIRHGVGCAQACVGHFVPRYYSLEAARQMLVGG